MQCVVTRDLNEYQAEQDRLADYDTALENYSDDVYDALDNVIAKLDTSELSDYVVEALNKAIDNFLESDELYDAIADEFDDYLEDCKNDY